MRVIVQNTTYSGGVLNGQSGRVGGFVGDRVVVKLDVGDRVVKLKCECLRKEGGNALWAGAPADQDAFAGGDFFAGLANFAAVAAAEGLRETLADRLGENLADRLAGGRGPGPAALRAREDSAAVERQLRSRLAATEATLRRERDATRGLAADLRAARSASVADAGTLLRGLDLASYDERGLADLASALASATAAVSTETVRRERAGGDSRTCVCCLDRPRNMVLLDCMHVVACEACAPRLRECPMCRAPVAQTRRIFQ